MSLLLKSKSFNHYLDHPINHVRCEQQNTMLFSNSSQLFADSNRARINRGFLNFYFDGQKRSFNRSSLSIFSYPIKQAHLRETPRTIFGSPQTNCAFVKIYLVLQKLELISTYLYLFLRFEDIEHMNLLSLLQYSIQAPWFKLPALGGNRLNHHKVSPIDINWLHDYPLDNR
ncbi:hypothetical protein BX600DRAFT_443006 [Xylariales sp. PMI_506]|nr:hypothetical protein BX600DRAFT_443006 [Xylariales sp. PMI_506]